MKHFPFLLIIVLAAGCSKKNGNPGNAPGELPTVEVTVGVPERKTIQWTVEQPGHILPFEVTPVIGRVLGNIANLHVDIDQRVRGPRTDWWGREIEPGTLLVEINAPEVEQEYKQEEAQTEQAKQEVLLARENLNVAEASYTVAQQLVKEMEAGEKRADANFQRWKGESIRVDDLVRRMVIDKQTGEETHNQLLSAASALDEAIARRKSSEAGLLESKAKLDRSKVEIQTSLARQAFAKADLARMGVMRGYLKIRAPYDGVITARHLHTGHLLQPSGGRGEQILTIARVDPVRVVVEVPESAADRVRQGTPATVRVQSLRGAEFKGQVARTSHILNQDVRTLHVEIDLPNPDGRIRPGMYAYASIPVEVPDVLTIPQSAAVYQDELSYVWLAEDGKASRWQIQIGQRDGSKLEVLRKRKGPQPWQPFTGNESVIVAQKGPLTEGQKVKQ